MQARLDHASCRTKDADAVVVFVVDATKRVVFDSHAVYNVIIMGPPFFDHPPPPPAPFVLPSLKSGTNVLHCGRDS